MDLYFNEFELWKQGAEAKLYCGQYFGKSVVAKERFPKTYRIAAIDERITKKRVAQEVKALQRCRKNGIRTPLIYFVDIPRSIIVLEKVDGTLLKDLINDHLGQQSSERNSDSIVPLVTLFGTCLATMHNSNIIHGDLTTSNVIVSDKKKGMDYNNYSICFIDFGLSSISSLVEDKGVDLYVLERAFLSSHPNTEHLFQKILKSYEQSCSGSKAIFKKFNEIKLRGRKRSMVG